MSELTVEQMHRITLDAMLERGQGWVCPECREINGFHNERCWQCLALYVEKAHPVKGEPEAGKS